MLSTTATDYEHILHGYIFELNKLANFEEVFYKVGKDLKKNMAIIYNLNQTLIAIEKVAGNLQHKKLFGGKKEKKNK